MASIQSQSCVIDAAEPMPASAVAVPLVPDVPVVAPEEVPASAVVLEPVLPIVPDVPDDVPVSAEADVSEPPLAGGVVVDEPVSAEAVVSELPLAGGVALEELSVVVEPVDDIFWQSERTMACWSLVSEEKPLLTSSCDFRVPLAGSVKKALAMSPDQPLGTPVSEVAAVVVCVLVPLLDWARATPLKQRVMAVAASNLWIMSRLLGWFGVAAAIAACAPPTRAAA
jgi:hypothetical protein